MNGKERVLRALEFNMPDRLPIDIWVSKSAHIKYGSALQEILDNNPIDIAFIDGPLDMGSTPKYYEVGEFTDAWGCGWQNLQEGIIGEVKHPAIDDYTKLEHYTPPTKLFLEEWQKSIEDIQKKIDYHNKKGKFVLGGWISLFERMQYLRGTEELYCDIALKEPQMLKLASKVMDFMNTYVDCWAGTAVDGIVFGDDWGTQLSLLISPNSWREIFKPMYKELIAKIKNAGKKVFFHSDGYILDIYDDFIEMGIDAINSQIWCMGVEKVAKKCGGKITFWGELSRQTTLPNGSVADIAEAISLMCKHLYVNNGGLIGLCEVSHDVPLANVSAVLKGWNNV